MSYWSDAYVGLSWAEKGTTPAGVSCWGLLVLAYRQELGLDLPTYADDFACSAERAEVEAVVAGATAGPTWRQVPLAEARDFDVATFRVGGVVSHVGLVCGPGRMLHITEGQESSVVSLRDGRWAQRRAGVYRHAALMESARAA